VGTARVVLRPGRMPDAAPSQVNQRKLSKMKKQMNTLVQNPFAGFALVVVVLLLIGGGVWLIFAGGDDDSPDTAKTETEAKKGKEDPLIEKLKKRKVTPAPVRRSPGTLDVARSEGRLAVAQARGRIKNPSGVSVRVSAAPKQEVTVDYQLSCYKAVGKTSQTRVANKRYRTTPPNTRSLSLPLSGADECTVSVGAQLTTGGSNGRVKVAVVTG
jgi:hypothetical protein